MTNASIDWTKPILWDGKPARVLATDLKGEWPVVVAVSDGDGGEYTAHCDPSGVFGVCQRITNAPERVERWANVYGTDGKIGVLAYTREAADVYARGFFRRSGLLYLAFEGDKLVDVAIVPLEDGA